LTQVTTVDNNWTILVSITTTTTTTTTTTMTTTTKERCRRALECGMFSLEKWKNSQCWNWQAVKVSFSGQRSQLIRSKITKDKHDANFQKWNTTTNLFTRLTKKHSQK
jgi:hypothetical protein